MRPSYLIINSFHNTACIAKQPLKITLSVCPYLYDFNQAEQLIYINPFIEVFFLTVSFGQFHGLILLPVLLTIFGKLPALQNLCLFLFLCLYYPHKVYIYIYNNVSLGQDYRIVCRLMFICSQFTKCSVLAC